MITLAELMSMKFFELLRLAFLDDIALVLRLWPVWVVIIGISFLLAFISRKR